MISAIGNALPRFDAMRIDTPAATTLGMSSTNATAATGGQSFATAMAEVVQDAARSLKGAETTSIQGINGGASTQAVVDAVMGAERTLQTAIAVRDKVVSAYLELSRMSI